MGRIEKKSNTTLSQIFLKYVLVMLVGLLILGAGIVMVFHLLVNTNRIYPANYAERRIEEAYETLQNADEVTEDMIPPLSHYAVFSQDGNLLSGNMSDDTIPIARSIAIDGTASGKYFYKVIERTNEYVVLQYSLKPQYQSVWLREHLPDPQTLLGVIAVAGAILMILLPSLRFGKMMKEKIQSVMQAAEEIKAQNLDYEVTHCGVKEIDDCLTSIDDMRAALKESLERQWKTEQDKNRQMSALAHDIKTPLTIVRGNAELLTETALTEEQTRYAGYIQNSALQIQNYVQTLIEVTKSAEGDTSKFETVKIKSLLYEIKKQTMGLAEVYHLDIDWNVQSGITTICLCRDQAVRAVMNIIKNAAEHTPTGGRIDVAVHEQGDKLVFIIEDTGSGFTQEALKYGTEQFFMDDTSRTGGNHYGIGLFSAKIVARKHGGDIKLSNSEVTGGARVEISFKC